MDNAVAFPRKEEPAVMLESLKSVPVRARTVSTSLSSPPKAKKASSLPNETVDYLKAWMMSPEHIAHPYPTEAEKAKIMEETGIELKQLTNWFVNNRKRYWKPRVEARLREQKLNVSSTPPPPIIKRDGSILSLADLASPRPSCEPTRSSKRGRLATSSPARNVVSGQSSVVSVSESASSSDDDDTSTVQNSPQKTASEVVVKTETVNVHILRPTLTGALPDLSDVSVLANVPVERVLRTYFNCDFTYNGSDSNRLSSRRDAEIVRLKKIHLALYLSESVNRGLESSATSTESATPRKKFRRVSVELWKEACQSAGHVYDSELPSLEEASKLFGFSS